jgi:hypothetical protein
MDGPAYRIGAIRECFEESGLLLAKKRGDDSGVLLDVDEAERERARKEIHDGKLRFVDWVKDLGGVVDSGTFFQMRVYTSTLILHRFVHPYHLATPFNFFEHYGYRS